MSIASLQTTVLCLAVTWLRRGRCDTGQRSPCPGEPRVSKRPAPSAQCHSQRVPRASSSLYLTTSTDFPRLEECCPVLLKLLQPNIGDIFMTWWRNIRWHSSKTWKAHTYNSSFRPTKHFYTENLEYRFWWPPPLAKKWNFVLNWYNEQAYYNQKVKQISLCMSSLQKWPPYLTMTKENKNFRFSTIFLDLGTSRAT